MTTQTHTDILTVLDYRTADFLGHLTDETLIARYWAEIEGDAVGAVDGEAYGFAGHVIYCEE